MRRFYFAERSRGLLFGFRGARAAGHDARSENHQNESGGGEKAGHYQAAPEEVFACRRLKQVRAEPSAVVDPEGRRRIPLLGDAKGMKNRRWLAAVWVA